MCGFKKAENIDRFSRKLLWLEVSVTNKDPTVIAGYYLKIVEHLRGIDKNKINSNSNVTFVFIQQKVV